jgi:H+/Cl- antiporter ClcA
MDQQTAKYIIASGIFIVIAGIFIYFFHDHFKWFGKLPGDIRVEKESYSFYFPFATMIVISIAISLIIYILKRFL